MCQLEGLMCPSCVLIKIIIGMNLISYAARRRIGMEAREDEDRINDFGRDPIGEGKDERVWINTAWIYVWCNTHANWLIAI